jgi:TonB family protein
MLRSAAFRVIAAPLFLSFILTARAADSWPAQVVTIEEMQLLSPLKISVPKSRQAGEIKRPTVIQAHVDSNGAVLRVALLESCGSPAHDEALLHSLRMARFAPKVIDGTPTDVRLVLPMHLPLPRAK